MRKSKDLIGLPVVSLQEGIRVGRVTGLVINPAEKAVAALVVEKGGLLREQKFVPFHQVHSIGGNAVTLHRVQHAAKGASLPEILRLFKEKVALTGSKVVAENGTILGSVIEYLIDTSTGMISALEIAAAKPAIVQGAALLDSSLVRTIGKEIVVVSDTAGESLTMVDGGLKERASHTWQEVKSRSQTLGQAIGTRIKGLRRPSESETDQAGPTGRTLPDSRKGNDQSNSFETDRSS
ncbi:MAG TPA: photosystem reaction center subunit H [Desulfotomaculum sp.]|nr:photosystem reaction center subunit H [Desulfotomaculum sp.]